MCLCLCLCSSSSNHHDHHDHHYYYYHINHYHHQAVISNDWLPASPSPPRPPLILGKWIMLELRMDTYTLGVGIELWLHGHPNDMYSKGHSYEIPYGMMFQSSSLTANWSGYSLTPLCMRLYNCFLIKVQILTLIVVNIELLSWLPLLVEAQRSYHCFLIKVGSQRSG